MSPGRLAFGAAPLMLLSVAAAAQNLTASFWFKGEPRNATDCIAFDPQFTRQHTLTVQDGKASVTTPGGIVLSLKATGPGVYEEDTVMDGLQLKMIANITTKTLTLSDKYIGCWWTAKWE